MQSSTPPSISGSGERGSGLMWTLHSQGRGEVGVARSFLGVCGELGGGNGTIVGGGVLGLDWSSKFSTSSALLCD